MLGNHAGPSMTIRIKSLILVFITACILAVIGTALTIFIVLPRFAQLEQRDAVNELQRLDETLAAYIRGLRPVANQWSDWDDAYAFVQDGNQAFKDTNLTEASLRNTDVDTLAYLDFGGHLVGAATLRPPAQGPLPPSLLSLMPGLLNDVRAGKDRFGPIAVDGAVYAFGAVPVLTSTSKGEPRGVLIILREFTPAVVDAIMAPVSLRVTMTALASVRSGAERSVVEVSSTALRCSSIVAGIDGRPAAVLTLDLPRPVHALGRETLRELLVAGIISLGLVAGLLLFLLERSVLRRIVRLGREVAAQELQPGIRITIEGGDEVASLAQVVERTVSTSREAATRAEANQQRYRMLFQRSADAILVVDGDAILDVNRAAARLFGAPSRRALSEIPFSRLVDGSTRQVPADGYDSGSRPAIPRAGKTSSDKLSEWTMYALDGRIVLAEVREAVVEIEGREAVQVLVRDVTDRRQGEAERRMLAGLLEATSDCILVADARGRVAFLNGSARMRLGVKPDEDLSQQHVSSFFAPISREAQEQVALPLARQGGVWRGETELLARDGSVFPASQVLVSVADEQGAITHLGSLLRDITVERQRESQLLKAHAAAEEAVRAKSSFLAIMSHELRTPLNGVIGMTSLLQESELSGESRELVDTIKICADNLLSLINDILDLSKIEAEGIDLERIRVNLRELVESAVLIVAEPALGKGLEIGCLVDPLVPDAILGDPTRLRQVLINLLGNAVKFTDKGEVLLQVSPAPAESRDPPGSMRLTFTIRDTGIGIAPEVLPRLFKPFVQGDDSTTRRHGGTGLGLAISQRLTQLMGSEIHVASTPDQGSVFTFTILLPVAQEATAHPAIRLASATVVVVESNPTARRIASAILASSHARVIEVPSIVQAVAAMRSGRIDLMLCGQQVADGDARELVEAIRFERGGARTGVVVMVPVFQRTKDQLLSQTGADALVVKPLRSANLVQVLEGVLERRMRDESVVSESVSEPTPVSGFSGKRILVVEDNQTNRTLALRILEVLGLRAVTVTSGLEALETLATETFDLVLMDCQMPDIDGLEATRLFREREARETALFRRSHAGHRHPRAVIVAVTAHAMGGDRERCIAAGMDDYLSKPYTIEDLRQMLEKWIG